MPVSAGFPFPVPSANFMAIYFCRLCEERGQKYPVNQREREKGSQLYHHQSFCLKEYIAIKSRKYAFTLANAAISLPLIQHHILCPGTSPPPVLFMKRNTLGATHCILTAKTLGVGPPEVPFFPTLIFILLLLLMFYYPAKSSKLKLLHSGPSSTL